MVYFDDRFLIEFSLLPLSVSSLYFLIQANEMRFTFSRARTHGLIILGVLFYVASIFLPWGIITSSSTYLYLPGSIILGNDVLLPVSDFLILMRVRAQLLAVSMLIKATILVGCAGAVLYWYVERLALSHAHRLALSYSVVLASSFLSFIAVAMFALTEISLSWGAYLALVGGTFMVLGVVMKELKVEVVVEREVSEQGG